MRKMFGLAAVNIDSMQQYFLVAMNVSHRKKAEKWIWMKHEQSHRIIWFRADIKTELC